MTDSNRDPRAERVAAAVRGWQRSLAEAGGSNTLLWFRDLPAGTLDLTTAHPGGVAMLLAGRPTRLSQLVRERAALEDARLRARTIRAKSVELEEERGLATGFLAVGMATWTVRGSARPLAPVLLRPCALKPTGAGHEDFWLDLGADAELNPVLEHYLRSEQGIGLDAAALVGLASVGSGFDPYPVYAALRRLCAQVPDFEVAPRLVLGNFSHAKLPMVADLAVHGDRLAEHEVVAALAGDPQAMAVLRSAVPHPVADPEPPGELLVLDADASQQAAIAAVRSGAHLVIDGPPGTGTSQTIANLVASLAGEGKRVLLVAEKRAALQSVRSRLEGVGLAGLLLDAYDGIGSRALRDDLDARADRGSATASGPDSGRLERDLTAARQALAEHTEALHGLREPWGVSAYQAQEAISALEARRPAPRSRVRVHGAELAALSRDRLQQLVVELTAVADRGAWSTEDRFDPWLAARISTDDDAARARHVAASLSKDVLEQLQTTLDEVFSEVRLPVARTVADWGRALSTVAKVRDTLEIFRPEVFDIPLAELVAATGTRQYRQTQGTQLGVVSRAQLRRQLRRLLRPGPPPADLHAALLEAQEQRLAWREMAGAGGRPEVPVELDRAQAAYASVERDLAWLGAALAPTSQGGDLLETPLPELKQRLAGLAARADRLAVVPTVIGALDRVRAAGLGPLVDDLAARRVGVPDVACELEFVWWASILEELTARDPRYGRHDGVALRRVVRDFVVADRERVRSGAEQVRAAVTAQLREARTEHPEQEALIRADAGKPKGHKPLRELLPLAGETMWALRPCWAMSPLVVASVLPPGVWFDVVILDEASQITPAHAISAISRARQVVVVGDRRQLPPTTFRTAATDEPLERPAGETAADAAESLLEALAPVLPTRRLGWHYRSRDERLIGFANRRLYDGALVTFPGTAGEPVLALDTVNGSGVLEQGHGSVETTTAEVDRVVELVLEHARTRPQETLGVVTLGAKHAARVEEALRRALARAGTDGVGRFFDEEAPERFFVKSVERVQGDARDAVILSIGYAKTPHGRVLHWFGPLSAEGGERYLNVAVTRARRRMTVVSSLQARDLDRARLKAGGAVLLRDYLAYAASGGEASAGTGGEAYAGTGGEASAGTGGEASAGAGGGGSEGSPGDGALLAGSGGAAAAHSALRAGFARRLRETSLVVHEDYGDSAYPIDFAVEDPRRPGIPVVAVETDGPGYAGIRSTRDRERLRVEQLERLGWRHVRVWSTDLYRDPARDVSRVVAAAEHGSPAPAAEPGPVLGAGRDTEPDRRPSSAAHEPRRATRPHAGYRSPPGDTEQTRDDTDLGWGERPAEGDWHDRWLREQRPPHWE